MTAKSDAVASPSAASSQGDTADKAEEYVQGATAAAAPPGHAAPVSSSEMEKDVEDEASEPVYVLARIAGGDSARLLKPGSRVRLLGLGTSQPIMQFGANVYRGQYEDTIGTNIVLEHHEKRTSGSVDGDYGKDSPPLRVSFYCYC